jgi:hypothetical protein
MVVVKNPAGDGYTVEAAIPFAGSGLQAEREPGAFVRPRVQRQRRDGGRRQFMWNGVARNSGDRGAWGRARLEK